MITSLKEGRRSRFSLCVSFASFFFPPTQGDLSELPLTVSIEAGQGGEEKEKERAKSKKENGLDILSRNVDFFFN